MVAKAMVLSISPLVGVEEWSAQRTKNQRGRCPADVSNHSVASSLAFAINPEPGEATGAILRVYHRYISART